MSTRPNCDTTIDWITNDGVPCTPRFDNDCVVFFLAYNHSDFTTILHCIQEYLISKDVKLLLVVSSSIRRASESNEVNQSRATNIMSNELASQLQSTRQLPIYRDIFYALRRIVKSPVAAGPSFCCPWRMCCICQMIQKQRERESLLVSELGYPFSGSNSLPQNVLRFPSLCV